MIKSRELRRARQREGQKRFNMEVGKWIKQDLSKSAFVPQGMTEAYANNRYVVMIYDESKTSHGGAKRVMIQNHLDEPIVNHWSEIMKIKNELFGVETVAVEYYPKQSHLINDHNIYWIWIFPEGVLPIPIMRK